MLGCDRAGAPVQLREVVVDPARLRAVDTPVFVADVTRLLSTGWRRTLTLDETLADLAAWWTEQSAG